MKFDMDTSKQTQVIGNILAANSSPSRQHTITIPTAMGVVLGNIFPF